MSGPIPGKPNVKGNSEISDSIELKNSRGQRTELVELMNTELEKDTRYESKVRRH